MLFLLLLHLGLDRNDWDLYPAIYNDMKVIVAGATGEAGRGIVKACLEEERITKLILLTRRNVAPEFEKDPRVEVIYHQDFSTYPEDLLQQLYGAEACLW